MKRLFVPMVFMMPLEPFPYTVNNGKLYQLIETEDEQWELHAHEIIQAGRTSLKAPD